MAWNPYGVALEIEAKAGAVKRISATQYTVEITASWETYYSGANTTYGMRASSGDETVTLSEFSNKGNTSGSKTFTGTYSISGNAGATKTIAVTFTNFNYNDASKSTTINLSVNVPALASYTVSYNANGGSGAPSSQTKWNGQALKLSTTKPTRTGHSFQGWATSASGSVAYASGASYTANSAVTLYAVWEANTYTVRYNENGGTGAPENQTKTYGVTLKLSSTKPTRTNYTFLGWGISAASTTASHQAGDNYTANAEITLYAVWELAYVKPRIDNLSISRYDVSSGAESDAGTSVSVKFNYACDQSIKTITVAWESPAGETGSVSIDNVGNSGSISEIVTSHTFATESTYTFTVTVTDASGYSAAVTTLPGTAFTIDLLVGGKGVSLGKPAELENVFDVAFQTRLLGGLLYPVIEPETDLDTIRTPGFYVGENVSDYNYTNCPLTSGTFTLEVLSGGDYGQTLQRLTRCHKTEPLVYERWFYTNAWGPWSGGWITATVTGPFSNYNGTASHAPQYRKDGRIVEVRGIITPTEDIEYSTTHTTIFTLPEGYRPSMPLYILCQGSGNCVWLLRVNTDGAVGFARYRNGETNTTCTAGTWLPFQVTYFAK